MELNDECEEWLVVPDQEKLGDKGLISWPSVCCVTKPKVEGLGCQIPMRVVNYSKKAVGLKRGHRIGTAQRGGYELEHSEFYQMRPQVVDIAEKEFGVDLGQVEVAQDIEWGETWKDWKDKKIVLNGPWQTLKSSMKRLEEQQPAEMVMFAPHIPPVIEWAEELEIPWIKVDKNQVKGFFVKMNKKGEEEELPLPPWDLMVLHAHSHHFKVRKRPKVPGEVVAVVRDPDKPLESSKVVLWEV